MARGTAGPTLTDARGKGGTIALDGFDFQLWDGLTRLPVWLRNPAFEGLMLEGLEDFEARFFAPHAPHGHVLDRFQAKSGELTRAKLIEVFNSFMAFDDAHPQAARVQTLVAQALPTNLRWIARDPDRVRRARPFYLPFSDICAASDDKLRKDLIGEFGQETGEFVANSVGIEFKTFPDVGAAEAAFSSTLNQAFPHLDVSHRKMAAAFATLRNLAAQSRGVMLTRAQLVDLIGDTLGASLLHHSDLPLHVRSDRNEEKSDVIEIDASPFSGGNGVFPAAERWAVELSNPLDLTARWARAHNYQRIKLTGSYRLSTAFAIGWFFRSSTGFEIDILTRTGPWATDNRPLANAAPLPWQISAAERLAQDHLRVAVGVLRDPSPEVLTSPICAQRESLLVAFLTQPLTNGLEAQVYVQAVKNAVSADVSRFGASQIDLFLAGPAAFAVALGHRWNALPPTQLHEFVLAERRYVPTLRLG